MAQRMAVARRMEPLVCQPVQARLPRRNFGRLRSAGRTASVEWIGSARGRGGPNYVGGDDELPGTLSGMGGVGGEGESALSLSEVATRQYTQLLGGLGLCGLPLLPPRHHNRPSRVQGRRAAELRPPLFSDKFLEILQKFTVCAGKRFCLEWL